MRLLGRAMMGCLLVGAVVAIGACGKSSKSASSGPKGPNVIDIYSSMPLQGASTAQTVPLVNGEKLALSQAGGRAGQWLINYSSLDDSTAAAGKWDPSQCAANARKAAADPKAVVYLAEFNSGCSEVSIPITNTAGISHISPANTHVPLSTNEAGRPPREPPEEHPAGEANDPPGASARPGPRA